MCVSDTQVVKVCWVEENSLVNVLEVVELKACSKQTEVREGGQGQKRVGSDET